MSDKDEEKSSAEISLEETMTLISDPNLYPHAVPTAPTPTSSSTPSLTTSTYGNTGSFTTGNYNRSRVDTSWSKTLQTYQTKDTIPKVTSDDSTLVVWLKATNKLLNAIGLTCLVLMNKWKYSHDEEKLDKVRVQIRKTQLYKEIKSKIENGDEVTIPYNDCKQTERLEIYYCAIVDNTPFLKRNVYQYLEETIDDSINEVIPDDFVYDKLRALYINTINYHIRGDTDSLVDRKQGLYTDPVFMLASAREAPAQLATRLKKEFGLINMMADSASCVSELEQVAIMRRGVSKVSTYKTTLQTLNLQRAKSFRETVAALQSDYLRYVKRDFKGLTINAHHTIDDKSDSTTTQTINNAHGKPFQSGLGLFDIKALAAVRDNKKLPYGFCFDYINKGRCDKQHSGCPFVHSTDTTKDISHLTKNIKNKLKGKNKTFANLVDSYNFGSSDSDSADSTCSNTTDSDNQSEILQAFAAFHKKYKKFNKNKGHANNRRERKKRYDRQRGKNNDKGRPRSDNNSRQVDSSVHQRSFQDAIKHIKDKNERANVAEAFDRACQLHDSDDSKSDSEN
jgi:hypothetical protein